MRIEKKSAGFNAPGIFNAERNLVAVKCGGNIYFLNASEGASGYNYFLRDYEKEAVCPKGRSVQDILESNINPWLLSNSKHSELLANLSKDYSVEEARSAGLILNEIKQCLDGEVFFRGSDGSYMPNHLKDFFDRVENERSNVSILEIEAIWKIFNVNLLLTEDRADFKKFLNNIASANHNGFYIPIERLDGIEDHLVGVIADEAVFYPNIFGTYRELEEKYFDGIRVFEKKLPTKHLVLKLKDSSKSLESFCLSVANSRKSNESETLPSYEDVVEMNQRVSENDAPGGNSVIFNIHFNFYGNITDETSKAGAKVSAAARNEDFLVVADGIEAGASKVDKSVEEVNSTSSSVTQSNQHQTIFPIFQVDNSVGLAGDGTADPE